MPRFLRVLAVLAAVASAASALLSGPVWGLILSAGFAGLVFALLRTAEKPRAWRGRLRRAVQAGSFLFFASLALPAPGGEAVESGLGPDLYVRLSPFLAAVESLASRSFIWRMWPALLLAAGAVSLGRAFCGWLCPLGAAIDLADGLTGRVALKRRPSLPTKPKYVLLGALLVLGALGVGGVAGWLDPLSMSVRGLAGALWGYLAEVIRTLLRMLSAVPVLPGTGALRDAAERALFGTRTLALEGQWAVALVMLVILSAGILWRRAWCRAVCPLGALLGLLGFRSMVRRRLTDACTSCRVCERRCPTECISDDGRKTRGGECILCLDCADACRQESVRFWPDLKVLGAPRGVLKGASGGAEDTETEVDLSRRALVGSIAAGILAAPVLGPLSLRRPGRASSGLIRPPGALPGSDLLQRCVRCGACMNSCPTGAIQPAGLAEGLSGVYTPRIVPRIGYCQYDCNICGTVCPTGAIGPLPVDAKHRTALGIAMFDTTRCIPWRAWHGWHEGREWSDRFNCLVCEENCPVPQKAIQIRRVSARRSPSGAGGRARRGGRRTGGRTGTSDAFLLPYVVEERCIGCGRCENVCPLPGRAGVRVSGYERQKVREVQVATGILSLLPGPEEIPGWEIASGPTEFPGKKLYDKIDGAAALHVTYNFVTAGAAVYTNGRSRIEVVLYEFDTPDNAWGLYSNQLDPSQKPGPFGQDSVKGSDSVLARRGRYFIEVRRDVEGEPTPGDLQAVAEAAWGRLAGVSAAPRPEVLKLLPKGHIPRTERYFHAMMVLAELVPLEEPKKGALGLGPEVEGVGAFYDLDQTQATLVVLLYPDEARAARAHGAARAGLAESFGSPKKLGPVAVFSTEDETAAVALSGRRLISGVVWEGGAAEPLAGLLGRALSGSAK